MIITGFSKSGICQILRSIYLGMNNMIINILVVDIAAHYTSEIFLTMIFDGRLEY